MDTGTDRNTVSTSEGDDRSAPYCARTYSERRTGDGDASAGERVPFGSAPVTLAA